jgi:hypothetical protein
VEWISDTERYVIGKLSVFQSETLSGEPTLCLAKLDMALGITQQDCAELLPLLQHFAATASLPAPGEGASVPQGEIDATALRTVQCQHCAMWIEEKVGVYRCPHCQRLMGERRQETDR